ncbi:MAG: phosphoribosyltransferase [Lachnospiraceae bacterium]|nr:phosphoribosyltransferase [Lachnospiraceae bacterium]
MYELAKSEEVKRLIAAAKSDSGVAGPELAKIHMRLGELLAGEMEGFYPADTTIVAILRGGIFFAEGIYFRLNCRFQTYDPKHEAFIRPNTPNVIIVDSVINTGKTIEKIIDDSMTIACCVINEKAAPLFHRQLYTVRVSKNSFVGCDVKKQSGNRGPDTTMRLFNQL